MTSVKYVVHQNQSQNKKYQSNNMSSFQHKKLINNLQELWFSQQSISHSLQNKKCQHILENRASTDLLQLSNTSCAGYSEKNNKCPSYKKYNSSLSPWNQKHQQRKHDNRSDNIKQISTDKVSQKPYLNYQYNQQDYDCLKQVIILPDNFQINRSGFIGQTQCSKSDFHQNIKKNPISSEQTIKHSKENILKKQHINLQRNLLQQKDKSRLYKKKLNKKQSTTKSIPLTQYQLKGQCGQSNANDFRTIQAKYWKFKVNSVCRPKKASKLFKSDKQNNIQQYVDKKKTVISSKKIFLLPERQKQNESLLHNPFTRMLYRKYISTISVNPRGPTLYCL